MRRLPLATLFGAAAALLAMDAHASLTPADGGLGIYDTVNHVMWTSDANLMATQAARYGRGPAAFVRTVIADSGGVIHDRRNLYSSGTYRLKPTDFRTKSGRMDWWGAQAWVHYLNVIDYGGSNQWALPTTVDNNSSIGFPNGAAGKPAMSSSQMAELFYGGLGQVDGYPLVARHNGSYSLFTNVQNADYWSGTQYSAEPVNAWLFGTSAGAQNDAIKIMSFYALAVTPWR